MKIKFHILETQIGLDIVVLIALLLSAFGGRSLPVDGTPEAPTATATAEVPAVVSETPAKIPTVAPSFTPTVSLTPTGEMLSALDLSAAGLGTIFRARVSLNNAYDLQRLKDWGIEILAQDGNEVIVKVDETNLARLARLGFAPTQIDSLDSYVDIC